MTEFCKTWSKYLPDNHRDALFSALCILADEFFDYELDNADHIFRELLPSKYLNLYDGLFLKRFYATLLTVGYKLDLPKKPDTLLACTAEELALHILIEEATGILGNDHIEAEFGDFEDAIFQDVDHEFLYDMSIDGFEDSEEVKELAMVNLSFSDWFKPFDNASMPVHPLCQDKYNAVD